MTESGYELGQCSSQCHPDRYVVVHRRVRLRKTWFVRDAHLAVDLRRPYMTEDGAELARISLARMELMERQASRVIPFGGRRKETPLSAVRTSTPPLTVAERREATRNVVNWVREQMGEDER